MPCTSCQESAESRRQAAQLDAALPMHANDLQVVEHNEVRPFTAADWPEDKHKLLVLLPEAFTPTCTDQIRHMKRWYPEFQKLDTELIMVCADNAQRLLAWFQSEPELQDRPYKAFSSYLLPLRLGMVDAGRARRALIFMLADGTVIKQEAFERVAPSFEEAHRILWAYTSGQYCGCDWKNPADGFLEPLT